MGKMPTQTHLGKMAKQTRVRLLEVIVSAQKEPTRWKWHVSEGGLELTHGYATSRETAQRDGDSALFTMLSASQSP
ncbi:hypothetical protein ABIE91_008564 [Bradyrhizobium elkanii]